LIAYPTDSCYALGCHLDDTQALERLRRIRGFGSKHHLTLMCRDLSEIAEYAIVDDARFRLLKAAIPSRYTFTLPPPPHIPPPAPRPPPRPVGWHARPRHAARRARPGPRCRARFAPRPERAAALGDAHPGRRSAPAVRRGRNSCARGEAHRPGDRRRSVRHRA